MCSVVGYVGKNFSKDVVIEGLSRLEYRGYDSAGFACITPSDRRLVHARAVGRLHNLVDILNQSPIDGYIGIGHTRWSTHGVSSPENAHPQFDCKHTIAVVHNGIIENFNEIKAELLAVGHIFRSDTDTEVIAHLLEELLKHYSDLNIVIQKIMARLHGAYAFVALLHDHADMLIAVRKRSPLCIGVGEDEMFIASDTLAFAGKVQHALFMPDDAYALVQRGSATIRDAHGVPCNVALQPLKHDWVALDKREYEHFMLKEIYEQKSVIVKTVSFLDSISAHVWKHMGITADDIKDLSSVHLVACGTSWHAARIAQFFFETVCKIPTFVHLASEFRYMPFFPTQRSLYLFISQSGETADTLEAVRFVNAMQLPTVAITNVPSSTLVRETGGFLVTQAGHEVAVASTKAFTTQLAALYWLAHRIALERDVITAQLMHDAYNDICMAAEVLENTIEHYKLSIVSNIAREYARYNHVVFLGRHMSYPCAQEAALKLKEVSYQFAQAYPAGELKHGPLALIDSSTPVFLLSSLDPLIYQKLLSNTQEVKARGGRLIVCAFEGQKELYDLADTLFVVQPVKPLLAPMAMTGLLQFLTYQIALELGRPIDKPRNLAKSVTVE